MELILVLILIACAVVVFGVMLRIWAATLRMAVSITNGVLGGRDLYEEDFRHRASAYDVIPRPKSLAGVLIPVPGVFYALLINVGCVIVSAVCQIGASAVAVMAFGLTVPATADPADPAVLSSLLGAVAVSFAASIFGTVLVLKLALPTTFLRAAAVAFCQTVIQAIIFAVVMGVAFLLGAANVARDVGPAQQGQGGWVR